MAIVKEASDELRQLSWLFNSVGLEENGVVGAEIPFFDYIGEVFCRIRCTAVMFAI